jgi:hypothetical protein
MKIKNELLQACLDYANKRIDNYKNELSTIKESIESNDKGGDDDDDSSSRDSDFGEAPTSALDFFGQVDGAA